MKNSIKQTKKTTLRERLGVAKKVNVEIRPNEFVDYDKTLVDLLSRNIEKKVAA